MEKCESCGEERPLLTALAQVEVDLGDSDVARRTGARLRLCRRCALRISPTRIVELIVAKWEKK